MERMDCFHVCTQEDLPVIFHSDNEFIIAMNAVAFVSFLLPDIELYTFELMSNHFHFSLSGKEEAVRLFFKKLIDKLASHPALSGAKKDILKMKPKYFRTNDPDNLRNVIAYINRNGAVVHPDENVFTYPWGANRFFFNTEAKLRHKESGRRSNQRERRALFNSHLLDKCDRDIFIVDGYVSPLCFCKIDKAERFFFNSRQYFYKISKNVESSKEIAKIIGERNFYTDDDLYSAVISLCNRKYTVHSPSELTSDSKIELARTLHYDYNASNKQICRILRMDIGIINQLFPN